MNYSRVYAVIVLTLILLAGCEFKTRIVDSTTLPEKVKAAWDSNYPGKTITEYATADGPDGFIMLTSQSGDFTYHLKVDSAGTVLGRMVEEAIGESELPAAAVDTIRAMYPAKDITDCMRLTENDSVSFFANIVVGEKGKFIEKEGFRFSPAGVILERTGSTTATGYTFRYSF